MSLPTDLINEIDRAVKESKPVTVLNKENGLPSDFAEFAKNYLFLQDLPERDADQQEQYEMCIDLLETAKEQGWHIAPEFEPKIQSWLKKNFHE